MNNSKSFLGLLLIIAVLAVLAISCKGQAIETKQKGDFAIEFLFEHDGCKVYRFLDGNYVYFSDCRGKIEHTTTTRSGKTTTTHHHTTLNN